MLFILLQKLLKDLIFHGQTKIQKSIFLEDNGTDLAARGTQLKNYFKFDKPDLEITPEMLKYAENNYVKDTNFNNNMDLFFKGITDYPKAAKLLSTYASGTVPFLMRSNENKTK